MRIKGFYENFFPFNPNFFPISPFFCKFCTRAFFSYICNQYNLAKGFTFVIDDAIDETPTAIPNAPSLREEQSSVFYDMTGRALQGTPTRPGVYIRNGKRFVVK